MVTLFLFACFDRGERDFNPAIDSVRIEPESGVVGSVLTCVVEASDPDGDEPVVAQAWTNASTGVAVGTGGTYTIDASTTSPGDLVRCDALVSDADRGLRVSGTATAEVLNSPPAVTVEVTPASGRIGDRFECRADATDADGDTPTVAYAWQVAGVEVGTDDWHTLAEGEAGGGDTLDCVITATDDAGETSEGSASAEVLNTPPGEMTLAIDPEHPIEQVDDVVCVVATPAPDVDGDSPTYTMSWTVGGVAFAGNTTGTWPGDTVPASATTADEDWICTAVSSDGEGPGGSSEATVTISRYNRAPTIDTLVANASEARVGDNLTCSGAASDADGHDISLAYAWSNTTTGTSLSSTSAYTVTASDTTPGDGLSCTLTATDSEGWDSSEAVSVTVLNSPPTAPSVSIDPSSPVEGIDDLVCQVSGDATDADDDPVGYTVSWTVDGVSYGSASTTTLAGDTVSSSATSAGEDWACYVVPNDGRDDGASGSDSVTVIIEGVSQVAGGESHTLALLADGTVWAWGWNGYGALGDGTTTDSSVPEEVTSLSGVVSIAATYGSSFAILSDGSLWAWGSNRDGQIGDGTKTNRSTPVEITALSDVVAVGGGYKHTLAVLGDGTVWAWGDNGYGQLGDGTYTSRTSPVEVSSISTAVSADGGYYHSLAVLSDGTAAAWGWNAYGQLGDGTTDIRTTPVAVNTLTDTTAVAAFNMFSLAIQSDGSLWAWGDNDYGQLGDGSGVDSSTPIELTSLPGVVSIAAGSHHGVAALSDGTAWAWGWNAYGQLGDGSTTQSLSPVEVSGVSGAVQVAAGLRFSAALLDDGTLMAWGDNSSGQLGDGTTTTRSSADAVTGIP